MEARDGAHAEQIFRTLKEDGYRPVRLESGAALE
jgi:hypothetical protein